MHTRAHKRRLIENVTRLTDPGALKHAQKLFFRHVTAMDTQVPLWCRQWSYCSLRFPLHLSHSGTNILSPKLTTVLFSQNLCISTCQSLHHLTLFSFHRGSANLRYHAPLSTNAAWLPENGLRHHTLSLFLPLPHAHKVWHIQRVAWHVNQCLRHAGTTDYLTDLILWRWQWSTNWNQDTRKERTSPCTSTASRTFYGVRLTKSYKSESWCSVALWSWWWWLLACSFGSRQSEETARLSEMCSSFSF